MPDLAERLRSGMADAVEDLAPSPGLDDLVRQRVRRRERHRRMATATSVVAALAVGAAGVGALSVPSGDGRPSVVAGPAALGAGGDDDGMLFLLADPPPAGFGKPMISTGGRSERMAVEVSPGWEHTLRFVDFDAAGRHPERILDVQWSPAGARDALARLPVEAGMVEATVRGHDGVASPAGGWLAWTEPDGRVVRLLGRNAPVGAESRSPGRPLGDDVLRAAAEALVPREGAGFDLPDPPGGFEPVAEWSGAVSVSLDPRQAVYQRPDDGATLYVTVSDDGGMPPGARLDTADAQRVEVRGREAVVSTSVVFGTGTVVGLPTVEPQQVGDVLVEWTEPGGELVTVGGTGVAPEELLGVAEDLVEVDPKTWFALAPGAGDSGDASAGEVTVPPLPASGPPAPDVTPAEPASADPAVETPAGVVRVAGTYAGIEHFTLTDGACPDLDHVHDATFTLTDGTVWPFHSEYCGDLEDDLWSGAGTFTLTVPGGDTVTGTFDKGWLAVPSTGRPILLTVTGGTGDYDGATGACEMDNHINVIEFGLQEHTGTFVCIFAP